MEATNLNLLTLIVFFWVFWILVFLLINFCKETYIFNKNYNLLSLWKYFYVKYIFLFLSFFIIFISIFWIKSSEKQIKNDAKWIDMIFVLDVSKSMNTFDILDSHNLYSRLDTAKKAISDFVVNHEFDRFWLVIFAWDAVSVSPLTNDHDVFLTFLDNVDYRNLTVQGSDFNKALSLWVDRFNTWTDRSKALVYISDGWDREDKINYSAMKEKSLEIKWIKYFVAWIWTEKWWKILIWNDIFGRHIYQQFNWNDIISKVNEVNLKDIANSINWEYLKISQVDDLEKLNKSIESLEKKSLVSLVNGYEYDESRNLGIASFIFFILFFNFLYIWG